MPLQASGEFARVIENLEAALDLAGQPVKRGTMAHRHIIYMMLADSAAQLQDATALKRFAAQLEPLAEQDEHRPYLAVAHRAWGIAHRLEGEYDKAQQRLAQALEIFEDLGTRWQAGRTWYEMAQLDLARSDEASAHDHYEQALAAFEGIKAVPAAKRTRAALEELSSAK